MVLLSDKLGLLLLYHHTVPEAERDEPLAIVQSTKDDIVIASSS